MSARLSPNDHLAKIKARARVTGDRGRVTRHEVADAVRAGCVIEAMVRLDHDDVERTTRVAQLPRYTHWRWLTDGAVTLRPDAPIDAAMADAERDALADLAVLVIEACDFAATSVPDHAMVLRGRPTRDHAGNELDAPTIILVPAGQIETQAADAAREVRP